ncbi:pilus assembly protein N-terminal domain-containing protein [Siccirubricoccus deserti]
MAAATPRPHRTSCASSKVKPKARSSGSDGTEIEILRTGLGADPRPAGCRAGAGCASARHARSACAPRHHSGSLAVHSHHGCRFRAADLLSGPASNVFVVDPRVAEVRPASPTSLFLLGMAPGRTTIAALDERGSVIGQYEVTVRPSTLVANEAAAAIARVMPGSTVRVVPQPRGLMLAGSVSSPDDAQRAVALAKGYIPEGQVIENQLSVRADTQVTLRVRIVEMSRNVTRDLGINWQALGSVGRFTVAFASKTSSACREAQSTRSSQGHRM